MKLDPSLVKARLEELHRGAVLRVTLTRAVLDDPKTAQKEKFFVLLNKNWPEDELLFALTTSKIDRYLWSRFQDEFLWVQAPRYSFWPVDTVVSLREIHCMPLASL
jgi:hypothetical protein